MSLLLDIAPADLGLPPKFTSFRDVQASALDYIFASGKSFIGANAPTGIGKSLLGVAVAKVMGAKAVYLTSTKSLQSQIQDDFRAIGMKDMRGRSNYPCRAYTTCDEGHLNRCHLRTTTACPRFAAYETAKSSDLISTNYACWMATRRASPGAFEVPNLNQPIELLICDEAHHAFDEIASFLAVSMPRSDYEHDRIALPGESGLMSDSSGDRWKSWASERTRVASRELISLVIKHGSVSQAKYHEGERYDELEELKLKLSQIRSMDDNWVWETSEKGVAFDIIWPARYASVLWSGVSTVLLLSATLWPYTMRLLGLSRERSDWREFSNGWPGNRGLVYYLPTIKLSASSTDDDYREMARVMDSIIEARSDRKGMVQTVSYARMRKLREFSRYRRIMHFNEAASGSLRAAERFRHAKPPAVLISPSFSTGWDFAYAQCEYQIIPKTPYPYAESRVMRERLKDSQYRYYVAMLELLQMIGRSRRAGDDRCETFILDKSFPLLYSKGKPYSPKNFSVHRISSLPPRPPKL